MKPSLLPVFLGALLAASSLLPPAPAQDQPRRLRITLPPQAASPPPAATTPAPGVTWLSTSRLLTMETTVELRFPANMVATWTGEPVSIDAAAARVPLTVTPALRGTWVWRSQVSGVFVPSEEPQRDQVYTFSVRPDQRDLQGQPLPAPQPTLELKAPGLKLTSRHPNWFRDGKSQRTPKILLQFNDSVTVPYPDRDMKFINKAGRIAQATARIATFQDLPRRHGISPSFVQQALQTAGAADAADPSPNLPLRGTLLVEASEPLPTGEKWRLEVTRLASADGKTSLAEPVVIEIGDIAPLHIQYSTANNEVGAPKSISLHFNQPLPPNLTAEEVLSHVSIVPQPPGYKTTFEQNAVQITGEFAHETKYQVNLTQGLKSEDGRLMTEPYQESFLFKVLQPEVALPAFSSNQLSSGRALLDVHSVNLKSVRVRVKAADRESLIYALRAYRHYESPEEGESETWDASDERSSFARIPFDAMPGQKIYEQEFPSAAPLDDQDEFVIDWRQALNGRKVGALFVTVEGEARPEWEGKSRRFGAQAFVQLTDIGLAWKLAGTEAFVMTFSQATGQPLSGVTVIAYDTEKNEVGRTVTAADGTGRLDRSRASWLLAETANDLHAVAIDGRGSEGLGMWRFGIAYDWEPVREARREVKVFTERPVYQPGHTVYFKAVSRLIDPEGIKMPAVAEKAVLKAYDAKGRLFHQRDVQFSASGSLDGTLELPTETLGYHHLELELPALPKPAASARDAEAEAEAEEEEGEEEGSNNRTDAFRAPFLVEEYKPNTFQIVFAPDSFKLDGESASLALQANYLLGKPLAKAKLAWTASVGDAVFHPDAFPGFSFLDSRESYYWNEEGYHEVPDLGDDVAEDSSNNLVTTQAKTDLTDDGRASLEFTVPKSTGLPRPRTVNVDAEVTDLNQQTITERWQQTFHASAFYLGINRADTMTGSGEPVDIALAAARADGEPWPQPVEARVTVEKVDFISVRVQTVGGGSNIKTSAQRGVVAEAAVTVMPKGQDSRHFTWTPREPGFYYITVRASDPDGRPVESVASFQVFGSGWANWQDRDGVRIDLEADKTSYVEGETARILIKSPVQGRALITVERRSVLRHFFVDLTSNAQIIELPIEAAMAPNVFVSAFIVRGADASPRQHKAPDYKVGFTELRVADARSRLAVAVAPGQPAYRPGDQGVASAVVTDGKGAPVEGAEVTFWAADDGVLTLRPYSPPDLWSLFHRPQPLAVVTGTSLMALLAEDPQELAFTNKGYMIGGGDEGMDAGGDRLRRNFQPVAFFRGALTTDAQGRVSVPFTVPDNLTRFRLIAVATAGPEAFGTGQASFEINKPLMIEPALPRFANVGDAVTVKGILLNNTDQAFEAEVSLSLDGVASSTEPLVKKVSIAPRGAEAVSFPLTFNEAGTATWQWKARSITPGVELADSMQSTLPVGYAQPVLREMHFATVKAEGESTNLLAAASPELLSGRGQVTVSVSNSPLNEASGAIAHLLHYPYGCVEQTTSSTLPWIAMHTLGDAVPTLKKSPKEISHAIQKGVDRLLSMQTSGGGLGYWPNAPQPELWASTYGGMGLALARDAGALVPQARLEELAAYLSGALRNVGSDIKTEEMYDRAFACYTLALLGKPEPAYHEALARKLNLMPHPARALLTLAMLSSGGSKQEAQQLLDAPIDPSLEQWRLNIFDGQLTALNLLVWIKLDPAHATTTALTERLLKERTSRGDWGSTYENGWALLALAADHQSRANQPKEGVFEIAFAGQQARISLTNDVSTQSVTLPFNGQASARQLTLNARQLGIYRVAIEIEARPAIVPVQPRNEGFGITRTYAKVAPNGTTGPADDLEVGDLVAITLDLNVAGPCRYLAVDDPLPAILEAVNPRFTSQSSTTPIARDKRDPWLQWMSSHQELRNDRALFFSDYIWRAGHFRLSYLARVVAEGVVTAPPAKIEAMYEPERYGLSGSQRISAKAAPGKMAGKSR